MIAEKCLQMALHVYLAKVHVSPSVRCHKQKCLVTVRNKSVLNRPPKKLAPPQPRHVRDQDLYGVLALISSPLGYLVAGLQKLFFSMFLTHFFIIYYFILFLSIGILIVHNGARHTKMKLENVYYFVLLQHLVSFHRYFNCT